MTRVATVLTHRRVGETAPALGALLAAARRADVTLRFDPDETRKHGLTPGEGLELNADLKHAVDLCIVMGGDGTILTALREYANTGVAVFAVNFGEVGSSRRSTRTGWTRSSTARSQASSTRWSCRASRSAAPKARGRR